MEETHWETNHFMPILHNLAYGNLGQLAIWALGLASERSSISPIQEFFYYCFGDPLTSIVEPVPRAEEP